MIEGYAKSNLYSFYSFYKTFPKIFQTVSGKSQNVDKVNIKNNLYILNVILCRDYFL